MSVTQSPFDRTDPIPYMTPGVDAPVSVDSVKNSVDIYRRSEHVAAIQWTGRNDDVIRRFGETLESDEYQFGFHRIGKFGVARLYAAIAFTWVSMWPRDWIVYDELIGFYPVRRLRFESAYSLEKGRADSAKGESGGTEQQ